jgi:hypothetical protein
MTMGLGLWFWVTPGYVGPKFLDRLEMTMDLGICYYGSGEGQGPL